MSKKEKQKKKEESRSEVVIRSYMYWPFWLLLLLILGDIIIFFLSWEAFAAASAISVCYIAMALWLYVTRRSRLLSALLDFTVTGNDLSRQIFDRLTMPCCVVDSHGGILWRNEAFREIIGKDKNAGRNLISLFPNVTEQMIQEQDAMTEIHSAYGGRSYCVDLLSITLTRGEDSFLEYLDSGSLTVCYLRDETEEVRLASELEDERVVCGLVYIDNYDEVLDGIEEVKRSLLSALVDRKINRYFTSMDGLIKKLEKDKYFFVLKEKSLQWMIRDHFSILDEVRQVNIGNDLALTLSIGIGHSAGSYSGNYALARQSIDMALGRGGDQVVVKTTERTSYYGGKSQTPEKMTRVKARVKAQAFQELLETKDKVFIMGHANCDVDSLGSAVGVYRMAAEMSKRAYIVETTVTAPILPLKERFLNNPDYPKDMFIDGNAARELVDDATALVVVDCNRPQILDDPELLKRCKTVVVFDHHRQSADFIRGAVLSYSEPSASSAAEMIAEMMQYIGDGIRVKPIEADCLYAGIVIDSQEFTNQTGVRTFEAAAYLRRCGADITRIRKVFRENLKDYQAKAEAISGTDIYRGAYAFARLSPKGIESPTVLCAQTANELLNIRGIKASIVLTLYNGIIYISARSIDEMNVQVLMEKLGGGGHRTIAGAQLTEGTIEEAIASVKEAIDEMIEEGEAN